MRWLKQLFDAPTGKDYLTLKHFLRVCLGILIICVLIGGSSYLIMLIPALAWTQIHPLAGLGVIGLYLVAVAAFAIMHE